MKKHPLLTCHFQVEWGGSRIAFSEVSGLSIENEVAEYREGSSKDYSAIKMPGIVKYNNIVLKRGIVKGDNEFYEWIRKVQPDHAERRDITIKLLDWEHKPVMIWSVKDAWPVKLEGPVLKSDASEVAIETLELAHEGLSIMIE